MKISSNVKDIISNVKLLNKTISAKTDQNVIDLAFKCQATAKSNVLTFDKEPETADNIKNDITLVFKKSSNVFTATITAQNENSKFYEYGTGIIGAETPHPESVVAGWIYNLPTPYKRVSSVTGRMGWFHDFAGGGFDANVKFTSGQPASAFMFKAYNSMINDNKNKLKNYMREAFDQALKG